MRVYIIQNNNHLINARLDVGSSDSTFIIIDKLAGSVISQKELSKIKNISNITVESLKPYIKSSSRIARIMNILFLKFDLDVKYTIKEIIIGNDGAFQKRIIEKINRRSGKKPKVTLWSDGLISYRKIGIFRYFACRFNRYLTYLNLDYFFPSVLALSSRLHQIVVLSKSCKKALIRYGVKESKIDIKLLPRHRAYMHQMKKNKSSEKSILIVFSAWSFHGHNSVEEWEINFAKEVIKKSVKSNIILRPHPMSSDSLKKVVELSKYGSKSSLEEDIMTSRYVCSLASTVLFDAKLLGKKVFVYEKGMENLEKGDFIDSLPRIRSIEELLNL